MQGWSPDFVPKLTGDAVDMKVIHKVLTITGPEAMKCSKELAQKEGIFVGITSGGTFAGGAQGVRRGAQGLDRAVHAAGHRRALPLHAAVRRHPGRHDRGRAEDLALDAERAAPAKGSLKEKVEPLPGSLSRRMSPPCSSTKRLVSASPRPVPSALRRRSRPTCWNSSNTAAWSSGAMPTPVSLHRHLDHPVVAARRHVHPPAVGRELHRVGEQVQHDLLELALVADELAEPLVHLEAQRRCRGAARAPGSASSRWRARSAGRSVDTSSSMRPASILERSRMSLISESRCRPDSWMSSRYSRLLLVHLAEHALGSTSEKPMIAFSGVRSSCDMLARNSRLVLVRDLELRGSSPGSP